MIEIDAVEYQEPEYDYWSDASGKVFAFAKDGSQDRFKPDDLRLMGEEETVTHLNPTPSLWTDGANLREAFAMDLPGWRRATDQEVEDILGAAHLEAFSMELRRLRSIADTTITPLQDAVDIDEATEQEVQSLKEWKRFRVALNRLPEQSGYPDTVEWPVTPA